MRRLSDSSGPNDSDSDFRFGSFRHAKVRKVTVCRKIRPRAKMKDDLSTMPTYVYHCSTCGADFEAVQRITEDPLRECPQGHAESVKRVMQPVAIAFKGAGFHINDYATSPPASSVPPSPLESKASGVSEPTALEPTAPESKAAEPMAAPAEVASTA
ncbi:MAG: hypothetical protein C4320_03715 [Armatimonadota bacterium]